MTPKTLRKAPGFGRAFRRRAGDPDRHSEGFEERKSGRSVLASPARRTIYSFVSKAPCTHLRAISRGTGLSVSTVKWHTDQMVEAGFLKAANVGNRRVYYAADQVGSDEAEVFSTLSDPAMRSVYLRIERDFPATQQALTQGLKLSQQRVSLILSRLSRLGLIAAIREGNANVYRTTPLLKEMSRRHRGGLSDLMSRLEQRFRDDRLLIQGVERSAGSIRFDLNLGMESVEIVVPIDPVEAVLEST